jgi:recombination protein RecT
MTTRQAPRTTETGQIVPRSEAVGDIQKWLKTNETWVKNALAKSIEPSRFVASVLAVIQENPRLLECTKTSIIRCIVGAGQAGLVFGNALGHAYIVPFRDKRHPGVTATLIIGYKGLVHLMHRTAGVSSVSAQVVREGDVFHYEFGLSPQLKHVPQALTGRPDQWPRVTYTYAILRFKDGSTQFDVMSRAEIDAVKARSRAGHEGPWVTDFPEMAKKSVVRRLGKLAPMSVEDQRLMVADELADAGLAQDDALPPVDLPAFDVPEEAPAETGEAGEPDGTAPTANGHAGAIPGQSEPRQAGAEALPRDPLEPRQIPPGQAGMTDQFIAALQLKLAAAKLWPVPFGLVFGQWKADKALLEMARAGWSERDVLEAVRRAG